MVFLDGSWRRLGNPPYCGCDCSKARAPPADFLLTHRTWWKQCWHRRSYSATRRYSFAGAASAARHSTGVCGRNNPSTKETSESKIHANQERRARCRCLQPKLSHYMRRVHNIHMRRVHGTLRAVEYRRVDSVAAASVASMSPKHRKSYIG